MWSESEQEGHDCGFPKASSSWGYVIESRFTIRAPAVLAIPFADDRIARQFARAGAPSSTALDPLNSKKNQIYQQDLRRENWDPTFS
jgi:nitrous oxide reductase accessory protein NosL